MQEGNEREELLYLAWDWEKKKKSSGPPRQMSRHCRRDLSLAVIKYMPQMYWLPGSQTADMFVHRQQNEQKTKSERKRERWWGGSFQAPAQNRRVMSRLRLTKMIRNQNVMSADAWIQTPHRWDCFMNAQRCEGKGVVLEALKWSAWSGLRSVGRWGVRQKHHSETRMSGLQEEKSFES